MSESSDEIHLVPFGPTRPVPEGHRWCMSCDGSGERFSDDDEVCNCEVCKGKGHWNADDIDAYHSKYPHVCQSSCGKTHVTPYFGSIEPIDMTEFNALMERARGLVEENGED